MSETHAAGMGSSETASSSLPQQAAQTQSTTNVAQKN